MVKVSRGLAYIGHDLGGKRRRLAGVWQKSIWTLTFAPLFCCHICTVKPASVRFHMPLRTNLRQPGGALRSAARVVVISSHSATTSGSSTLPLAWILARMSIASAPRSFFASLRKVRILSAVDLVCSCYHRGDSGKNGKPIIRMKQGTNCIPQAVRNEAGPGMK